MATRKSLWLVLGLSVHLGAGGLNAQTFGQPEQLSVIDVEDVVQAEPESMRLVEPMRDLGSGLEPSALEDLSEGAQDDSFDGPDENPNEDQRGPGDSASEPRRGDGDSQDLSTERERETLRRSATTLAQLQKLKAPLNQIQLSGLGTEDGPTSRAGEIGELGQDPSLGYQQADNRWITASAESGQAVTKQTTHYSRRPLYFEDVSLERCGKSDGCLGTEILTHGIWTNGKSAAKFLVDTTLLPYRMLRQRPDQLVSARAK